MTLIDSISGILILKAPSRVVLKVGGFSLNVTISLATYESLPKINEKVVLLSHLHVKEDLLDLYGFKDDEERSLFINLTSISGIGPKSAVNILSGTNPLEFKSKIIAGDVKSLTIIPGIGVKTAKRIIVELKEKFELNIDDENNLGFSDNENDSMIKDAANALQSLGYKSKQINIALNELKSNNLTPSTLEETIRIVLQKMV